LFVLQSRYSIGALPGTNLFLVKITEDSYNGCSNVTSFLDNNILLLEILPSRGLCEGFVCVEYVLRLVGDYYETSKRPATQWLYFVSDSKWSCYGHRCLLEYFT